MKSTYTLHSRVWAYKMSYTTSWFDALELKLCRNSSIRAPFAVGGDEVSPAPVAVGGEEVSHAPVAVGGLSFRTKEVLKETRFGTNI